MNGPFGNMFPYTNFHGLNLDWVIQVTKDFLDQYTNIETTISDGLTALDEKAEALQQLLQDWYDTHSADIADQLAGALEDLNEWYTTHQDYLDQTLQQKTQAFNDAADAKGAETLDSIPDDYTELFNRVVTDSNTMSEISSVLPNKITPVYSSIEGIANFDGTGGYYETTYPYDFHTDTDNISCTGLIPINGFDSVIAYGRLNNNGFAITFLDSTGKVLPDISVTASTSSVEYIGRNINLNDDDYKDAFYVAVSYYGSESTGHEAFLKLTNIPIDTNDTNEYYGKLGQLPYHGYVHNTDYAIIWDTSNNVYATGLIPVKKGDFISAYGKMGSSAYLVSFFDKYKKFIPSISVIGTGVGNYVNVGIDTGSSSYNDIAYVLYSNYDNENKGCFFVTHEQTYNDELINKIPFLSMQHIPSSIEGGWNRGGHNSGSGIHSTPLIPINNKIVDKIQARTYINQNYYRIAFFDKKKSIMTSICRYNEALADVTEVIDITGSEYNNARYVSITSWAGSDGNIPGTEHWLFIHCHDYINALIAHTKNLNTNSIFKKVVCVGDSYMEGWFKVAGDSDWSAHPEYSWPHYMEHITGNEWVNLGISGATTWSWLSNTNGLAKAQQEGHTQAYVIGLLINDTAGSLGTAEDIGTENNTYYAGLSKVIRSLAAISPDAHIFVLTCPRYQNETYNNFNQAVRDIISTYTGTYKVHLIDLAANYKMFTTNSFASDSINGHYTAIGYQQMAEFLNYLISDYINNNVSNFQDVYKISYDE